MPHDNETKSTFLNRREWGSYLIALQVAASYPMMMDVVKTGRAWFNEGAAHASNWLGGENRLPDKFSVG